MEQTICTTKPDRVYDRHFGFYVNRLTPDASIPVLQKEAGAIWAPVYVALGQETELAHILAREQITAYYPVLLSETGVRAPFFPGIVFAALTEKKRPIIANHFWVSEIMNIDDHDTEELVFADIVFMGMAEHISRFYPFTYEKELPGTHDSKVIPMTINGFGDCHIISSEKSENIQLFFNFKTVNKALNFDLSLYQLRSLILANVLPCA